MNKYKKYCTGCGLCEAVGECKLKKNEKGFYSPSFNTDFFRKVCPISGRHTSKLDKENIWGRNRGVYLGWSNDAHVRKKASSGGILTEVARYLLISQKIDIVIHVGADSDDPTKTRVFFSKNPEEVVSHCGSRYGISSPLSVLDKLEEGMRYAFIGKPCDVVALRNYMDINPELKEIIPYLLSFFCMGVPSDIAQKNLLEKLESKNCKYLDYRGNGWPGFATATDKDGVVHKITYDESWGEILGRDLMPVCKLCIDGIGELADISCGDAWYLTKDNKPDFSEYDGRNVVFARTVRGSKLLVEMQEKGFITLDEYENYRIELPQIQQSQWNRRREMKSRIAAMKWALRPFPCYNSKLLKFYASGLSVKQDIRILGSSYKRIIKGKM